MSEPESVESQPSKKPSPIRSFIIKHEMLFTMLGALIVFVGFFVKEGVRETLKDLTSAIDQAETAFLIRNQLFTTDQRVMDLNETLVEMETRKERSLANPGGLLVQLGSVIDATLRDMDANELTIELATTLLEKLPTPSKELNANREFYYEQVAAAASLRHEMIRHRTNLRYLPAMNSPEWKQIRNEKVGALVGPQPKDQKLLNSELHLFSSEVLKEAKNEAKQQELRVHEATVAVYILFCLGWGLGLIGKVLKVPAFGGVGE